VTATGAASDARGALLGRLIDHAALFPPASMSVPDAVAEDRRARESPYAWVLARFVCPASKLAALGGEMPWGDAPGLSVVVDTDDPAPVEQAAETGAPVEAVEMRLPEPVPRTELLSETSRRLPWTAYFELVLDDRWRETIPEAVGAVAAAGGRVKLRCGGQSVPATEQVALVMAACRDAGCVFKATAGLHHPVRRGGEEGRGDEHGFVNLLAAAAFAHVYGLTAAELEPVLAEEDPGAFAITPERISAAGWSASHAEIAASRERLFAGFGSCSWREPVDDLRALGLL
jgi:hypothetical protein